ncbi:MAG: hypothetical protein R6X33_15990 [Candidatus Brocadiia bacterium]
MRKPRHRSIRELLRELLMSPPEVRRKHADRLESLLLELDPEPAYPFEFLYFRITGFRPEEQSQQAFQGEEVLPDLHLVLESLSEAVPQSTEDVEDEVLTVAEVARVHNVSTRTVHRWRRRGLVARKYVFPDGRVRVGIRRAALERFAQLRGEQLEQSRSFSRMDEEEEERIIDRVEQFRREGDLSLTEAAGRVAEQVGRSQESVRLLLKRYSEKNPDRELLRAQPGTIERADRRRIYRAFRQGTPADALARQYDRSRSSIYRIINQERARNLLKSQWEFVASEDFRRPDFEEKVLGDQWENLLAQLEAQEGAGGTGQPRNAEEETAVFRAYNYTKYLLAEGQKRLNPRRYVSGRLVSRLEELQRRAERIRRALAHAYQPAAEQVARQHAGEGVPLEDLLSEAREGLDEALNTFDYRGRARFPSFLKLQLQKRFARLLKTPRGG